MRRTAEVGDRDATTTQRRTRARCHACTQFYCNKPITHELVREQRTHSASFLRLFTINTYAIPTLDLTLLVRYPPSGWKHEARPERTAPRTPSNTCRKTLRVCWLENWRRLHPYLYTVAHAQYRLLDKRAIERTNVCNENRKTLCYVVSNMKEASKARNLQRT